MTLYTAGEYKPVWRSIVISSVCLSVRLSVCPTEYIRNGTTLAIFTNFVHVAYSRGSVLLGQGDEIPRGWGNFGVFRPLTMHFNEMLFGLWTPVGLRNHVLDMGGSGSSRK